MAGARAIIGGVGPATSTEQTGSGLRRAGRVLVTIAAAAGMAYLLLLAVLLAVVRCGDGCDAEAGPDHWRWTAQLALALVGVTAGGAALVLGSTSPRRGHRVLLVVAAGALGGWLLWVVGFGRF